MRTGCIVAWLVLSAAGMAQQTDPAAPQPDTTVTDASTEQVAAPDPAAEQDDAASEAAADDAPAWLTGDWGGLRTEWEQEGIVIEGTWTVDVADVIGGGVRQRSTTQNLLDLGAAFDLDTLWGLRGATAFVEVWTKHGRVLNDDVGDWQGTSNIDTPAQTQNAELWYEQWLLPERLRVKVGKVDAFDEFAVVDGAAEFLNNGPAYSPTLSALPSYPDPAWSINLFCYPTSNTWVGAAAYDGATQAGTPTGSHGADTFLGSPGDLFLIAEAGGSWAADDEILGGRLGVGWWNHTGDFDRFDGGTQTGTSGAYMVFDQALWRELPGEPDDAQGIDLFTACGVADGHVIEVDRHAAAGLTWTGVLPGRDEEMLGLGASWANFSDDPGAGFTENSELAIELFYRLQSTPWLSIKPDLQYVIHPGGDASLDDALVATLRFDFSI